MNSPRLFMPPADMPLPDGLLPIDASQAGSPSAPVRTMERFPRRLLLGAGLTCAAQIVASKGEAQNLGAGPTSSWKRPELRLARRITMGLTAQEAALALKLGYQPYLERQLNPASLDDSVVDRYIAQTYPTLTMPAGQLSISNSKPQLIQATIYRALFSQRQLLERMVEFWTDHFNVNIQKAGWLKIPNDLEVIRPNALGKFPDLLRASAHSPAMLNFLDVASSRKENPNQNYARELMELHTLGIDGGYTQQDVLEVARCFTGWTYGTDSKTPATFGKFLFNSSVHDNGQKMVLGHTIPANGGQADGETVLNILASHPSTATHIATKMLCWLLQETPSTDQISHIARVYMQTGGDIKAMIRAILRPSLLMSAPAKFKRPFHLVTSTLRATSASVLALDRIQVSLEMIGQPHFQWAPPNGFPDTMEYWVGMMVSRLNFGSYLLYSQIGNVHIDLTALKAAKSSADVLQMFNMALFAGEMSTSLTMSLSQYLNQNPQGDARISALGLALASPDFQWY